MKGDGWDAWYFAARREMEFRYGVRRIPKDRYKEQFALGRTVQEAALVIYERLHSEGKGRT